MAWIPAVQCQLALVPLSTPQAVERCRVEQNPFPRPAGHADDDAAQDIVGYKNILLKINIQRNHLKKIKCR